MLGFTVKQDFEGDQFTFFKPSMAEIEALYGLRLDELAVYDGLEKHALVQAARGSVVMVEVDAIFLPDTAGTTYGREHSKTTIGILAIDKAGRRLDYLHNAGRFTLSGADYDGIFAETTLPPYAEFVRPSRSGAGGAPAARRPRPAAEEPAGRPPAQPGEGLRGLPRGDRRGLVVAPSRCSTNTRSTRRASSAPTSRCWAAISHG